MKNNIKKIFSLLLALVIILGAVPSNVMAEEGEDAKTYIVPYTVRKVSKEGEEDLFEYKYDLTSLEKEAFNVFMMYGKNEANLTELVTKIELSYNDGNTSFYPGGGIDISDNYSISLPLNEGLEKLGELTIQAKDGDLFEPGLTHGDTYIGIWAQKVETFDTNLIIHKILMDSFNGFEHKEYDPNKGIDNIEDYFNSFINDEGEKKPLGNNAREVYDVSFAIYEGKLADVLDKNGKPNEGLEPIATIKGNEEEEKAAEISLVKGIYTIVEIKDENSKYSGMKAIPTEIDLPLSNETEIYDTVHIYPKNTEEKPEIEKNIYENSTEDGSFNIGDHIAWNINVKFPEGTEYKKIKIQDKASEGITLDAVEAEEKIEVYGDSELYEGEYSKYLGELEMGKDKDFTTTQTDNKREYTLTEEGLKNVNNWLKTESINLKIQIGGMLNDKAVIDGEGNNNDATLTYDDEPKVELETPSKVYTGGKKFIKKDSKEDSKYLAGAKFEVYELDELTGVKYYLHELKYSLTKDGESISGTMNGFYQEGDLSDIKQEGEEESPLEKEKISLKSYLAHVYGIEEKEINNITIEKKVLESGEDGKFEVTGLVYGTYYLEEIVAPNGYAKLADDIEFIVEKGSYDNEKSLLEVINKLITIPETGGIGSIIFVVVGFGVALTAVIVKRKRKIA